MLPTNLLLQNRYRIIRPIGRGGMGAVYEALDQRLDHSVAVKQILHGDAQAFEREARLLARLHHPALPKVSDHFIEDVGQFLVMEFIPGDDLARAWLRRKDPFTPMEVLAWADQLLVALDYLHSQTPPVIHRDIKPANLKLNSHGALVLLDFGLAKGKVGETSEPQKSAAGYTLAYAAPEQIRGEGTEPRSDLYSVAATLYDLLTGARPPDAIERALALADNKPDPLRATPAQHSAMSWAVVEVLCRAMALRPAERFASAQEMRAALRAAVDTPATVVVSAPHSATPVVASLPLPTTAPHNLPAQLTPLVGRQPVIANLLQLLRRADVRLVTLTGAGGSGKTRLGQQVASDLRPDFPDGVFWVSLAPLRDSGLVASTIAQALGVKEVAGQLLVDGLQAYLRPKRLLLLLDNFEQIIPAAPLVNDLLTACPALKVIVTSREVLRVRGEREFLVPLLAVPNLAQPAAVTTLAHYAAVELFVQRAQAIKPDFTLDESNARAVAEICTRLDGLPLALELAAARIKLLTPQAILTKLSDLFRFLSSGARDLPDRQRTLRATIDWSYDLLTADEQILFRRLAVFVGGRTLAAVEAVCNPRDDAQVASLQIDVLDGLSSLVDKNLLYQTTDLSGEQRFMMLVTIHEYAAARLVESGEAKQICAQHAEFFTNLAEEAEPELRGPNHGAWLERLEIEHDNFRAVLQWAGKYNKNEIALRLSSSLGMFWYIRSSYLNEGRMWLNKVLIQSEKQQTVARAKALRRTGWLAHLQGDTDLATKLMEKSLALYRKLENETGIVSTLNTLGVVAQVQGDYKRSRRLHEEGLAIFRKLNDKLGIAASLNNLGNITFFQEDYVQAVPLYKEALTLHKTQGDKHGHALVACNLGMVTFFLDDYDQATGFLSEALSLRRELEDTCGIAETLNNQGYVALKNNDYDQARKLNEESLILRQQIGDKKGIAECLESFADLNYVQGCLDKAIRLYGRADSLRSESGNALPPPYEKIVRRTLTALHTMLDEEAFAKAWAAGQTMTLQKAIEYALQTIN